MKKGGKRKWSSELNDEIDENDENFDSNRQQEVDEEEDR